MTTMQQITREAAIRQYQDDYARKWKAQCEIEKQKPGVPKLSNNFVTAESLKRKPRANMVAASKRRDKIVEMIEAGSTRGEIRAAFGITAKTLSGDLTEIIAAGRIKGLEGEHILIRKRVDRRRAEVAELLKEGVSLQEIADRFGLSPHTIKEDRTVLRKAGVVV